ncbi:MAG TPA: helix-turn-helix domain-containing protein, partial [Acidimicrobiales bacterium]|nr:helix-turn-helix domain-containing protein [Acidimicrobiales bacterium]
MQIDSVGDIVAAVRGRRLALGLSQAELAARAGVSRHWLTSFEGGKPTVELAHVLRLLDALAIRLDLVDDRRETKSPPT